MYNQPKGDVNMRIITEKLIEEFKCYLMEEEKSSATLEKYIRDVNMFMKWSQNCEITKARVLEYKNELTERYAPASVNSILSSLNSFFNYSQWHECKVKSVKIQKQIFTNKDKELTKEEYGRLLQAASNRKNKKLFYLMQTMCSLGIRVSELKYVDVTAVKTGQARINCKGKIRIVILPKKLCKILKGYIKESGISKGAVFVSKGGRPLDRSNIWKMLKSLCEEANVSKDKVFPHNLRHLFARTYYSIQKDIVRLADILGHSNVNTTRIYTMESCELHRKHIEKLGLLRC